MSKRRVIKSAIGDCPLCGKLRYTSKKNAKATAKEQHPTEHLSVYPCGNYWHLGHLPYSVQRGWNPRG